MYDEEAEANKPPPLPVPFIKLDDKPSDQPSAVNRLTTRLSIIRERWAEDSQVFPPAYGWELGIEHDLPAYLLPDKKLGEKEWQTEFGWIEKPTMVCVLTKWRGTMHPTEQQKTAVEDSLIFIGFGKKVGLHPTLEITDYPLCVVPNACQPLFLTLDHTTIYLKAQKGTTPTVSIFVA